jgi:hypothetical protein
MRRKCRNGGAGLDCGIDGPGDQLGRDERPRGIVHHHHVRALADGAESNRDRLLPPGAARPTVSGTCRPRWRSTVAWRHDDDTRQPGRWR